jgi:hypothetical protein
MNGETILKKNILRRTFGVLVCFSPLMLMIASATYGLVQPRHPKFDGVGFMISALVIVLLNFYLSFIRSYLFFRRHGSMEGYRRDSGVPMIGSILEHFHKSCSVASV